MGTDGGEVSPSVGHFQSRGTADDVAAAILYLHREFDKRFRTVHKHEIRAYGALLASIVGYNERHGVLYARTRVGRASGQYVEHRGKVETVGKGDCIGVVSLTVTLPPGLA